MGGKKGEGGGGSAGNSALQRSVSTTTQGAFTTTPEDKKTACKILMSENKVENIFLSCLISILLLSVADIHNIQQEDSEFRGQNIIDNCNRVYNGRRKGGLILYRKKTLSGPTLSGISHQIPTLFFCFALENSLRAEFT